MIVHPTKGEFDDEAAEWKTAAPGSSVGLAFQGELIGMRNLADPDSPILVFTPSEWTAFTLGVKDGEFDVACEDAVTCATGCAEPAAA